MYPFSGVDSGKVRPSAELPRSSAEGQLSTEKLVSEVNGYSQTIITSKNFEDFFLAEEEEKEPQ